MNRAGQYRTNLSGDLAYRSFVPAPLPPVPVLALDEDGLQTLVRAAAQITLLEGLAKRIPNVSLFVSMYVRKEALLSSQIEGTQATLDDILDPMRRQNANLDVSDVVNYIKATEFAIQRMQELPLCNRLIREIHAVLMQGVRGQEKSPGAFRISQNWIGGEGSTIKSARYIPPSPEDMAQAMSDLEKFMNSDESNALIQAALIHYQFETIHPFLDGNGRVGRLLITLFLMDKKILTTPAMYISYYLKINRIEYYDRMTEVRKTGNYEQWVKFFLQAIYESAQNAVETIDELLAIHDRNLTLLSGQNQSVKKVFTYLEGNPIIEIKATASALGCSYNTVSKAVSILMEKGVLAQTGKAGRTRIFSYTEYLDILRRDT